MNKNPPDFFNQDIAKIYDDRNSKLLKISDCSFFLLSLILKNLPDKARVLCVGAGTGAEIIFLSQIYPEWTFVALEPSGPMLEVCREKTRKAGIQDRCEFVNSYIHEMDKGENFDAVLSLLVGHFVPLDIRAKFYQEMTDRLKVGGTLASVEISYDLESKEFPFMIKNWESIQALMGATSETLAMLPKLLKEKLVVLSPSKIVELIKQSGIQRPVPFFQAFMIHGFYGIKENQKQHKD